MALFPVSTQKEKLLLERMLTLGIREQDIDEQFIRSSGAGGQNVNKVSSCLKAAQCLSFVWFTRLNDCVSLRANLTGRYSYVRSFQVEHD
jgi:hypothetical protein